MTGFDVANIVLRLAVTAIVVYKLSTFRDAANITERMGLGMMGGGSFLTIPIIIDRGASPFDGWATSVMTLGMLLLLVGRTYRDWKHSSRNAEQVRQSRSYLESRGKL